MTGITRDLTKNIGDDQKGIGRNRREREEKNQKKSIKKKKKKNLRKEKQKNGMKMMKQGRWEISMMSCKKFLGQKFLRGEYCHKLT